MSINMDALLGKQESEPKCNQFIHWFKAGAKTGDSCLCGKTVKQPKKRKKE